MSNLPRYVGVEPVHFKPQCSWQETSWRPAGSLGGLNQTDSYDDFMARSPAVDWGFCLRSKDTGLTRSCARDLARQVCHAETECQGFGELHVAGPSPDRPAQPCLLQVPQLVAVDTTEAFSTGAIGASSLPMLFFSICVPLAASQYLLEIFKGTLAVLYQQSRNSSTRGSRLSLVTNILANDTHRRQLSLV